MDAALAQLLEPISADAPCGPDLSNDSRLDRIETILRGKPEVDIGKVVRPAEPPDWGALKNACLEFLVKSKHLRPAVVLCCCLARTDGLMGFRDGLRVLRAFIETFWGNVYPALDSDDGNDPQQRLNIIGGLTASRNAYGLGWLQIVDYLYTAPLCRPQGAPPPTLDALDSAEAPPAPGAPAGMADTATLRKQIAGGGDDAAANLAAAREALEALEAVDQYLTSTLGSSGSINFDELRAVLQRIESVLAGAATGGGGTSTGGGGVATRPRGGRSGGDSAAVVVDGGVIRSRDDVVRVLEGVCEYYRQCEPGSPVPYVIKRAQKLAMMNFVDAMQELDLATLDKLRPSMGSTVEAPPA